MWMLSKKLMNWASILEDHTREQAERDGLDAVHPPAPRADARRPPGQGRHRRLGHPDARRDHPGRGRRRHRLRHDGRPDPVHRATISPARPGRAARRDRARRSAVGRQVQHRASTATRTAGRIAELEELRRRSTRPSAIAPNWRLQLGSLGSGNHFIEVIARRGRTASGCSCTPARAGVGNKLAQQAHQGRPGAVRAAGGSACPTRTWPTWSRATASSGPTSATCAGRSSSRCSTARR